MESEELKNHKEIVLKFFEDCEREKLFKKSYDSNAIHRMITRIDVHNLAYDATIKINTYHDCSEHTSFLTNKENNAFQFSRYICYIRDMISEFESYLKLMIDLDINDNVTYGKLFGSICKALKYENCWKKLNDVFFFRS